VCGGEDAEHDVLVERALEVSAQAVQHAVIRHAEVQHLGTTVCIFSKKKVEVRSRIRMLLDLPDPDPLVRGLDPGSNSDPAPGPDSDPAPDPSIIKQKT
jgi:hypothetical protein